MTSESTSDEVFLYGTAVLSFSHIYIYIYICVCVCVCVCVSLNLSGYIYIYIYIYKTFSIPLNLLTERVLSED